MSGLFNAFKGGGGVPVPRPRPGSAANPADAMVSGAGAGSGSAIPRPRPTMANSATAPAPAPKTTSEVGVPRPRPTMAQANPGITPELMSGVGGFVEEQVPLHAQMYGDVEQDLPARGSRQTAEPAPREYKKVRRAAGDRTGYPSRQKIAEDQRKQSSRKKDDELTKRLTIVERILRNIQNPPAMADVMSGRATGGPR